jgi:lysozyme family protein
MKIYDYNNFILELEFDNIINELFKITEDNHFIDDTEEILKDTNKIKDKIKSFVEKLSKDKIKSYYERLISKIQSLPKENRIRIIMLITPIFISQIGLNALISNINLPKETQKQELFQVLEIDRTSSFETSQKYVKEVEKGYSSDKKDRGNYIKLKNGKKKFIGTNHGISAVILSEYLGRDINKNDMINLKYETALKIYKKKYWDPQNLQTFSNQSVANLIYDGCVNQGINGMRSILKKSLKENGIEVKDNENVFSKDIILKVNLLDQEKLFNSIKKHRENKYKNSITFKNHGRGWLNRLNNIEFVPIKSDVNL